jgi:ABC-type transporter Mla subunit MlaD
MSEASHRVAEKRQDASRLMLELEALVAELESSLPILDDALAQTDGFEAKMARRAVERLKAKLESL